MYVKKKEKEIRELAQTVMSEPKPAPEPVAAPEATEPVANGTEAPQEGEHSAAAAGDSDEGVKTEGKVEDGEKKIEAEDAPMEDASATAAEN